MSKELKLMTFVMSALEEDMNEDVRGERLQLMLTADELKALDDFRFGRRMPSRASAVRELLRRGLAAEGFAVADGGTKSSDYGVLHGKSADGDTA